MSGFLIKEGKAEQTFRNAYTSSYISKSRWKEKKKNQSINQWKITCLSRAHHFKILWNVIMAMSGFANYVREYRDPWAVCQNTTPGDEEMNVWLGPLQGNDIIHSFDKMRDRESGRGERERERGPCSFSEWKHVLMQPFTIVMTRERGRMEEVYSENMASLSTLMAFLLCRWLSRPWKLVWVRRVTFCLYTKCPIGE